MRYQGSVVLGEVDERSILEHYEHAIELDSSFAPAYLTPIRLATYLDGARVGRRYARAYLSLAPSGPRSDFIRLADVLLDPDRAVDARRRRASWTRFRRISCASRRACLAT